MRRGIIPVPYGMIQKWQIMSNIKPAFNNFLQNLYKKVYKYPFLQAVYLLLTGGYTHMLVYYEMDQRSFKCLTSKIIFRLHRAMIKRQSEIPTKKLSKTINNLRGAYEKAVIEMDQFSKIYYNILEEIKNPNAVMAIDFDGTICEHKFPEIGEPNWEFIHYIQWRQKHGARTILWTCRTGGKLDEAVKWCEERGLYFDAVNENVIDVVNAYGSECRKVYADEYYDDLAVNIFKFPFIPVNK